MKNMHTLHEPPRQLHSVIKAHTKVALGHPSLDLLPPWPQCLSAAFKSLQVVFTFIQAKDKTLM